MTSENKKYKLVYQDDQFTKVLVGYILKSEDENFIKFRTTQNNEFMIGKVHIISMKLLREWEP